MNKPLKKLGLEINEINRANGWDVLTPESWTHAYQIPAALALVHSEVSEALEGFRKSDQENVGEELIDVVIRTLDILSGLGYPIDLLIEAKLAKNRTRGYKHGGKRI